MDKIERGAGPVLLFLHGTAPPETMYGLAERLSDDFRTVVASLPGYGQSARNAGSSPEDVVDALVGMVDDLETDEISLIGHSGGAYYALALACRMPERIGRIALLAPAHHIDEGLKEELPQFADAARTGELGFETVAPLWFSDSFGAANPDKIRMLEAPYERDIAGMADDLDRYVDAGDLRPQFSSLEIPIYVRSGTADVRTPPETVGALEDLLPDVAIDWVDGAGHMVQIEDAAATTDALRRFFSRQPRT